MTSLVVSDTWSQLNQDILACTRYPRLVAWREEVARTKRRTYRTCDYWGKPVPGFGVPEARLFIIGLAPGAHGSNRTRRMFTGDSSGATLFPALYRAGFASQPQATTRDDALQLRDTFITAIGRCAPPKNRPSPEELTNCRPFLQREIALLSQVQVVLALGKMAFDGYGRLWREQGQAVPRLKFAHGARHVLPGDLPLLMVSYHPSRQNTQTGRLTMAMFEAVFTEIAEVLGTYPLLLVQ